MNVPIFLMLALPWKRKGSLFYLVQICLIGVVSFLTATLCLHDEMQNQAANSCFLPKLIIRPTVPFKAGDKDERPTMAMTRVARLMDVLPDDLIAGPVIFEMKKLSFAGDGDASPFEKSVLLLGFPPDGQQMKCLLGVSAKSAGFHQGELPVVGLSRPLFRKLGKNGSPPFALKISKKDGFKPYLPITVRMTALAIDLPSDTADLVIAPFSIAQSLSGFEGRASLIGIYTDRIQRVAALLENDLGEDLSIQHAQDLLPLLDPFGKGQTPLNFLYGGLAVSAFIFFAASIIDAGSRGQSMPRILNIRHLFLITLLETVVICVPGMISGVFSASLGNSNGRLSGSPSLWLGQLVLFFFCLAGSLVSTRIAARSKRY